MQDIDMATISPAQLTAGRDLLIRFFPARWHPELTDREIIEKAYAVTEEIKPALLRIAEFAKPYFDRN